MVFYAKYFQLLILENGFAKQGSCLEFRVSSSIPTIPTFFSRYVQQSLYNAVAVHSGKI